MKLQKHKKTSSKRKDWDEMNTKEKILGVTVLIVIVIILLSIIGSITNGDDATNNKSSSGQATQSEQQPTTQETTAIKLPRYQVVQSKNNVGIANNTEYYVLTDSIDFSNEKFKDQIKAIVIDLAKKEGKLEFQANIYTDKEVLEYYYDSSAKLPYPDGFSATKEQIATNVKYTKKMARRAETALIASYTGGFDYDAIEVSKDDDAYKILWFGSATKSNSVVGKYVGDEKWKPSI